MTRNRLIAFISAGVLTLGVGAGATSALAAGSPSAQPAGPGATATQPATAAMQPTVAKQAVRTPAKHTAHARIVRHTAKPAAHSTQAVRPVKGLKNAAPRKAIKGLKNAAPRKATTVRAASRMS